MTYLYNCKSDGDEWRITKFTENLELVEGSSYLCTVEECQCPAGVRPMCRHREMLPKFFHRGFVDTGYFFDYDRGGWVDMRTEDEEEPALSPAPALTLQAAEPAFGTGPMMQAVAEQQAENKQDHLALSQADTLLSLPALTKWRRF